MGGTHYYRTLFSTTDLWQLPLLLILLFGFTYWWKNRRYNNDLISSYIIPALSLRLISAVLALLLYQVYYGYGDTYGYFYCGRQIWNALWEEPVAGLELLFRAPENYSILANSYADHPLFSSRDSRFLAQIIAVLSVFTVKNYLSISLILTYLSFVGCWKMFKVFYRLYPSLHFQLALATLFVPSVFFWGAGIMKESVVLFGLGLAVDGLFSVFHLGRKGSTKHFAYFLIGAFILFKIKPYILILLLVAFIPLFIFTRVRKLEPNSYRFFASFSLVAFFAGLAFVGLMVIGTVLQSYQPEKALQYLSLIQQTQIEKNKEYGGTGYTLPLMEPTIPGFLKNATAGVNVTLFRPYPWEVRKVINVPAMIESLLTLLLTLFVFFRAGPFQFFYRMFRSPVVLFCLLFSVLVSMFIGLVAFNFGTLVRYKVPILPFYYVGLILLYYSHSAELYEKSIKGLYDKVPRDVSR